MKQKNLFVDKLIKYERDTLITFNPINLNPINYGNWFMMFNPKCWGKYAKGFGVHFAFIYYKDSASGGEYIRLPVGVENPFMVDLRKQFKADVVSYIKKNDVKIGNCRLWPDVGFRKTKLIEPELVELNDYSWKTTIDNYMILKEFNNTVASFLKQYNSKGCFIKNLYEPA
jgi:hypothetical protein